MRRRRRFHIPRGGEPAPEWAGRPPRKGGGSRPVVVVLLHEAQMATLATAQQLREMDSPGSEEGQRLLTAACELALGYMSDN